jgi:hypothetical protein
MPSEPGVTEIPSKSTASAVEYVRFTPGARYSATMLTKRPRSANCLLTFAAWAIYSLEHAEARIPKLRPSMVGKELLKIER